MKKISLIVVLCVLAAGLTYFLIPDSPVSPTDPHADSRVAETETSIDRQLSESDQQTTLADGTAITQSQITEVLDQIESRTGGNQTATVPGDLEELLERYDEMSHAEKRDLLTAYATLFLRNSQYDDARYFYEQILELPSLDYTNRLAVLQMLARIAIAAEDWEGFLVYNDQYFDEGGGYNWVVTGNLIRAFQQLENFNAAGEALLLHIDTGIHPEYDGSNEQYQRLYSRVDSIPLDMADRQTAVLVAEKMVEQFDRPENWKILSELYSANGDVMSFSQTVEAARAKGFVDDSGEWVIDDPNL